MTTALGIVTALTLGAPTTASADDPAAAEDGWETNHPGLVWTGAIFSGASLLNFGVVGGYSGEEPDTLFHVALFSGAAHYLIGVTLLATGLILDASDDDETPMPSAKTGPPPFVWTF